MQEEEVKETQLCQIWGQVGFQSLETNTNLEMSNLNRLLWPYSLTRRSNLQQKSLRCVACCVKTLRRLLLCWLSRTEWRCGLVAQIAVIWTCGDILHYVEDYCQLTEDQCQLTAYRQTVSQLLLLSWRITQSVLFVTLTKARSAEIV